jgi:uncharacterized membrane protein
VLFGESDADIDAVSDYVVPVSAPLAESGTVIARPSRAFSAVRRRVNAAHMVWAVAAIVGIGWAAVAVVRESRFIDPKYNLGNFTQAVWSTAHGHFLQITEIGGTEVSRLGIHVDPIIALFAPLWLLWPSPLLLLTVQAAVLALGAIPLFWLARKHLRREWDAALLAFAYLVCPTVAWNAVTAFSAVALAVPLLLFAIWYLDEGRLGAFAVTAGLAVLCQEQIGLIVGCLGLWYAWQRNRLSLGLTIAAIGLAATAIDFLVVLKHFSGGSPFAARYGGSPTGLLHQLFTDPLALLRQINSHDLLGLALVVPVIGLCFGSTMMLVSLPQIALLLLSRRWGEWSWTGANVLLLVPFIYAATVFVLERFARTESPRRVHPVAVLAASSLAAVALGPFGIAGAGGLLQSHALNAQRHGVRLIPPSASVSATTHLALQLAARRHLDSFPVLTDADWVAVDARDPWLPNTAFIRRRVGIEIGVNDLVRRPRLLRHDISWLRRSAQWKLVYARDYIFVFRRRPRPRDHAS